MKGRRVLFVAVTAAVALLGIEFATRAVFSYQAGRSLFLYGFGASEPEQRRGMLFPGRFDPMDWDRTLAADDREKTWLDHASGPYSRYAPHQYKRTRDEYGHLSDIRINDRGVRGPDVEAVKREGVYRVITLGASSTFGYRNRDDETYPRYLEAALHAALEARRSRDPAACADVQRFEVINFGIPHLDAAQIRSFFLAEGLALDPDAVTFYEGANETRLLSPSLPQRVASALGGHLLSVRFVQSALQDQLSMFTADELAEHLEGRRERFLAAVAQIADACAARGIEFVAASQAAKSFLVERDEMAGVSHAEERRRVRARLDTEGRIDFKQLVFLMHADLMDALRAWVDARGTPFADVSGAFDRAGKRDQLLSWVHLSAEGNRIVADVLAATLFEHACGAGHDPG